MEKQPLTFLRAGFGRLSDSLLEFPLASSHVTLDKWPNPSASWSPPKLDERMRAKSQPTWPVTAPRQTLTPKAVPHGALPLASPGLEQCVLGGSAHLLPLPPEPRGPQDAAPGEQHPVQ